MLSYKDLHSYQLYAIEQIIKKEKLALWLEMGLGKTIIVLTALAKLKQKAIIIAPKTVVYNVWKQEAKKWEHTKELNIELVVGTPEERKESLQKDADIYVISRDSVSWLFQQEVPTKILIIDESTSFKDRSTLRWASLCQKSITTAGKKHYRKQALIEQFQRVVLLSGTPASESYQGLWAQIYLLDRGERLEKTIGRFRELYMLTQLYHGYPIYCKMKKGAIESINEKLKDICISMRTSDYLNLPKRIDIIQHIGKADSRYDIMENDGVLTIDNTDIIAGNRLTLYEKLQQINSGFIYDEHGGIHDINKNKIEVLQDLITDENILIFYRYKYEKEQLKKIGGVPLETPEAIKLWNKRKIKIGLIYPGSSGRGLNLESGGSIAIWYTLPLSLEEYIQSNARLYRQGQKKIVRIYHLIVPCTIDEYIYKLLKNKEEVLQGLLRYFKGGLSC